MALNLRDFLTALGKDLIRIDDEVDPITQAGALCSAAPRPILLERLRGFPDWKLCDILVSDRARQALALGTSPQSVVRELSDRMFTRVPGQSKVVPDGPCKEVKLLGNDADITKLPIPIHSEGDAGRYLGSGITITRDPDTSVRNEAIIRAMVKGPRKMGFWMAARHNWAHLMKYQERKQPAPMAFAIGLHPGYEILANYSGRHEGCGELEMGAGVLGETLELVKCETIDLEVPAQAEVVIEGVVPPGVREPEGPFGEFTGYSKGAEGPAPVLEVTAITRRRDPIFRHMQATVFTDHQPLVSVPMEASLYRRLREIHGHTEVHDVYIPPWVTMFTVFVQMTPRWDGQARAVLLGALSSPYLHPKIAIAVDEDVDIYDPREVFWAMSTRVNPEKDVIVLPHERIHPLDVSAPNVDRQEVTVIRGGGQVADDGHLVIGAMARQRAVETSTLIRERCPLLAEAMPQIGHVQIRNRGTFGGSLAHADPAAELPAVVAALGGEIVLQSARGRRRLTADQFFVGYLTTAAEPTELLVEVKLPATPRRTGSAFLEVSRRHGDFALVGVATTLTLDDRGVCTACSVALTGVGPTPVLARDAARALVGGPPSPQAIEEVGRRVSQGLRPDSDLHASSEYRKDVAGVLTRRALARAAERARGESR